ncbi:MULTISPECIES: hypothetical protein [unclassified Streptomyces]|uniref:hypothetical protein n=1 Tax=unclassified Streptomyces TaxID=2593676 RepID=UPI002E2CA145|nr:MULTISPECIES: hypothetical protein [unclassified Streptomyces]WUB85817.1 hypothetical protein OG812_04080 [Streptomyces sp. NBC_00566]
MRDDRDDTDDTDDRDASHTRRPPPPGEVHWLPPRGPDDECPWCRLLMQPAEPPPEPPPGRLTIRRPARLRTVMVAFSALVTLVGAVLTLWRP